MASVNARFSLIVAFLLSALISACAASKDVSPEETAMIICHDDRRTLTLPEAEAVKHLDHGDNIGVCAGK